jgi:hypothetical protein
VLEATNHTVILLITRPFEPYMAKTPSIKATGGDPLVKVAKPMISAFPGSIAVYVCPLMENTIPVMREACKTGGAVDVPIWKTEPLMVRF